MSYDYPVNGQRILACSECKFFMVDVDYVKDSASGKWGHQCGEGSSRRHRCESHMELFEPCVPKSSS